MDCIDSRVSNRDQITGADVVLLSFLGHRSIAPVQLCYVVYDLSTDGATLYRLGRAYLKRK